MLSFQGQFPDSILQQLRQLAGLGRTPKQQMIDQQRHRLNDAPAHGDDSHVYKELKALEKQQQTAVEVERNIARFWCVENPSQVPKRQYSPVEQMLVDFSTGLPLQQQQQQPPQQQALR